MSTYMCRHVTWKPYRNCFIPDDPRVWVATKLPEGVSGQGSTKREAIRSAKHRAGLIRSERRHHEKEAENQGTRS